MKELHYGEGYQYAHDYEDKLTTMQCLPPTLQGTIYYEPTMQGSESKVTARMKQIEEWRKKHK